MSAAAALTEDLEQRVLSTLRAVTAGPAGPDVVTSGEVYAVVATGGAVRLLLDPDKIPADRQDALAEFITPLVESVPGVDHVVVKPRPRSIAVRDNIPGIRHVVGVHSGKGGVGKSTVAVNVAVALARRGFRIGLLDADVYGPSCPTLLGLSGRAKLSPDGTRMEPREGYGVKLMSLGFLMPAGRALAWRGSLVEQGLTQLFSDVHWGEVDILFVDLPPGTSDVHLAAARHVAFSGVVTVTSPGQVSVQDVRRGLEMFADVAVPCLGLVENMTGVRCRRCGHVSPLFGDDGGQELAADTGVPLLARIPFVPAVVTGGDEGKPIVVADPDSLAAIALGSLAWSIADALAIRTRQEAGSCA